MYKQLPVYRYGVKYVFNPILGFVYSITGYDNISDKNSLCNNNKYQNLVLNPFLLHKRDAGSRPKISTFARFYAHLLLFIWKYCYPLVYLLSYLRFPLYKDAGEANMAFREILQNRDQKVLCLPRSIFISTTSVKFKSSGALFIGCFFPTRHMHAWVIEEGMHADIHDTQWIMFTPLVMMK